jgi:hypothetical protein
MTVYGMDPQAQRQGSLGTAVLAGAGVAVAGAVVWGLIAYLTKYQLSLMAVFLGAAVGAVMFRVGGRIRNPALAAAAGVLAILGCALGSLIAQILVLLSDGIPGSLIMSHLNLVLRAYPSSVGALGLFFWAIAAIYGYRIALGRPLVRTRYGRQPAPPAGGQYPGFGAGQQSPATSLGPGQPPVTGFGPGQPPPVTGFGPDQPPPVTGSGPGQPTAP